MDEEDGGSKGEKKGKGAALVECAYGWAMESGRRFMDVAEKRGRKVRIDPTIQPPPPLIHLICLNDTKILSEVAA